MRFFIIVLMCMSARVLSVTELEAKCSSLKESVYFRGSCYHKSSVVAAANSNPECNDIVNANNYAGHLAFILDEETATTVSEALLPPGVHAYTGGKGFGGVFHWSHHDGRTWQFARDQKSRLYEPIQAQAVGAAALTLDSGGKLHDWEEWIAHLYICQYREKDFCFKKAADNKKGSDLAAIGTYKDTDGTDCAQYCRDAPVCQSFSHDENTCIQYTYMSGGMELQDAQGFMLCEKP